MAGTTTAMCASFKQELAQALHCFSATQTPTGNTTNTSTNVASLSSIANLSVGMPITGTGIPASTVIAALAASSLTLSQAATATNTGTTLTSPAISLPWLWSRPRPPALTVRLRPIIRTSPATRMRYPAPDTPLAALHGPQRKIPRRRIPAVPRSGRGRSTRHGRAPRSPAPVALSTTLPHAAAQPAAPFRYTTSVERKQFLPVLSPSFCRPTPTARRSCVFNKKNNKKAPSIAAALSLEYSP